MRRFLSLSLLCFTVLLFLSSGPLRAQAKDRSKVPDEMKWDLTDLYASDQAWKEAKDALAGRLDSVLQYKGKLGDSAKDLLACLDLMSDLQKEFGRLRSYASMKADLNLKNAEAVGMEQSLGPLAADFGASEAHLAKVMQRLVKAGLVASTRGPKGGFRLARPAETVTLLDVYEAVEGPVEPLGCLLGRPACRGSVCMFGDFLRDFDTRFRGYMATTTLHQLVSYEESIHGGAADHHD